MINTEKEIKKHERIIRVYEMIAYYQAAIKHNQRSLQGVPGTFPELVEKYNHNIEIYVKCIERLVKRLVKLNELT